MCLRREGEGEAHRGGRISQSIDTTNMVVREAKEMLVVVLGAQPTGRSDGQVRAASTDVRLGVGRVGTSVLNTSLSSYFTVPSLYRTAANQPSFLRLVGVHVAGSGRASGRRCSLVRGVSGLVVVGSCRYGGAVRAPSATEWRAAR